MGWIRTGSLVLHGVLSCAAAVIGCASGEDTETVPTTVGTGGAGGGQGGSGGDAPSTGGSGGTGGCDDADDCTAMGDECNKGACVNGECAKLPENDGTPCEDGLFCTDGDVCDRGSCIGGQPKVCAPASSCEMGVCDEASKSCVQGPGNEG